MNDYIPTRDEVEAMTPGQRKGLEVRLRRAADRQGLALQRQRARDTRHILYGTYQLVDPYADAVVYSADRGYGLDLVDVAEYLFRERA